jgi:hypothetical protein
MSYCGEVLEIVKHYFIDIENAESTKDSSKEIWEITPKVIVLKQEDGQYLLLIENDCLRTILIFRGEERKAYFDPKSEYVYFLISDYDHETDISYIKESKMVFKVVQYKEKLKREIK